MDEFQLTENSLHSLEIEKSILGAILIDPNIIYNISRYFIPIKLFVQ